MDEAAAQRVLLVQAVETADAGSKVLTADDRGYAGRAAAELVRWRAADRGTNASSEAFVAKRAELLAAKVLERFPRTDRILRAMAWRPWIGAVLPLVAFMLGVAVERIADPGHVSILAFPLLGLVVWNVAVYLWLVADRTRALLARTARKPGWLQRMIGGAGRNLPGRLSGPLAGALTQFAFDWAKRSAPLVSARAARVLHLCAAMLALGAIAGLYVRGLAFEYRAGWESTFLGADMVHRILQWFLLPAARLTGQSLPGVEEIAALRWSTGTTGENAARWIHLYTATVVLGVMIPRLLLAAFARMRERRWSTRFPLSLEEPYFRRVLASWRPSPAHVRVVPYAFTPSDAAGDGLQRCVTQLFGEGTRMHVSRPVAFGDEDSFELDTNRSAPAPDLVVALFNLGSTPETENHGVFLDRLKSQSPGTVAMMVDEASYRQRLGAQAGSEARLAERRQAWSGLASTRAMNAVCVDLEAPDLDAVAGALSTVLSGRTASIGDS